MINKISLSRCIPVLILGATLGFSSFPALAQSPGNTASQPGQQNSQQGQEKQNPPGPTGQSPATSQQPAQNQTNTPPTTQAADQSKSQLTTREQESLEHEKKTGTSNDRIFWIIPNFLSLQSTEKNVPTLTAGDKFKAQVRSMVDPYEFFQTAVVAGIGQAANSTPSYGQGMSGYGLRYATAYGDNVTENFMAGAVLPALLHQDPRYYELGHGGFWRRTGHALSRLAITKSDSGKTEFNYSEVMGAGMAAALSTYTYHPTSERTLPNVVTVWGTQMGYDLATYMLKEFWPDLRHRHHKHDQDTTTTTPPAASPTK